MFLDDISDFNTKRSHSGELKQKGVYLMKNAGVPYLQVETEQQSQGGTWKGPVPCAAAPWGHRGVNCNVPGRI